SKPQPTVNRYLQTLESGTAQVFGKFCGVQDLLDQATPANVDYGNGNNRTEDYDAIARRVVDDPIGIAVIPFAFYEKYAAGLVVLAPDGARPSFQTVNNKSYPLSRDLFLYSTVAILARPEVFNLINFAVASTNTMLEDIHYFPATIRMRRDSEDLLRRVPRQ